MHEKAYSYSVLNTCVCAVRAFVAVPAFIIITLLICSVSDFHYEGHFHLPAATSRLKHLMKNRRISQGVAVKVVRYTASESPEGSQTEFYELHEEDEELQGKLIATALIPIGLFVISVCACIVLVLIIYRYIYMG